MLEDKIVLYNKESWKNEASLHGLNSAQQMVMSLGGFVLMYRESSWSRVTEVMPDNDTVLPAP